MTLETHGYSGLHPVLPVEWQQASKEEMYAREDADSLELKTGRKQKWKPKQSTPSKEVPSGSGPGSDLSPRPDLTT
jgi:hypothetical protein